MLASNNSFCSVCWPFLTFHKLYKLHLQYQSALFLICSLIFYWYHVWPHSYHEICVVFNFYCNIVDLQHCIPGLPGSSVGKESACSAGNLGSIPRLGRSPGEGNGRLFPYSCLENPMDRGAWWATVSGFARVGHDLATKPPSQRCGSFCCIAKWISYTYTYIHSSPM